MSRPTAKYRISAEDDTKSVLDKIDSRLANLGKNASTAAGITAVIGSLTLAGKLFTDTTVAVGRYTMKMLEADDRLQKLSHRLKVSTDWLSQMQYAAASGGVSFETFAMGVQRMTRRLAEAAKGGGEAQGAIKELGLDLNALMQMRPEDQFYAIATALDSVQNGSDRVRLAMRFFDTEGVALLQMIEGGGDALRKWEQKADKAGATLKQQVAENAAKASDAILDLNKEIDRIKNNFVRNFYPTIEAVARTAADVLEETAPYFETLTKTFFISVERIGLGLEALLRIGGAVQQLTVAGMPFMGITESTINVVSLVNKGLTKTRQELDLIYSSTGRPGSGFIGPRSPIMILMDQLSELEGKLPDFQKTSKDYQGALASYFESIETPSQRFQRETEELAEFAQQYDALVKAINTKRLELYGKGFIGPIQLLDEFNSNDIWMMYRARFEEATKVVDQWAEHLKNIGGQAAQDIYGSLSDFFFDPAEESFEGLWRGFSNAIRRMLADAAAAQWLRALFGGTDDGGNKLGGIFGSFLTGVLTQNSNTPAPTTSGKRAGGGTVLGGNAYLIGEKGPEWMIPGKTGAVIPNGGFGGGGTINFSYSIDARGADPAAAGRMIMAMEQTKEQTKREIAEMIRLGDIPIPTGG